MKKGGVFFYGWLLVGLAFVTLTLAYAVRYAFSIFYPAILADMGWSRAATAGVLSGSLIVYAASAPFIGGLVDRFKVRKVVPVGAVLLGLALAGASRINAPWQLYVMFGLTSLGTCALGYVPHLTIIANWFSRSRGLAMGVAQAGFGASMATAPAVQLLISKVGWRGTYLVFAVIVVAVIAPLGAIFLRQRPEEKGLTPDGIEEGAVPTVASRPRPQMLVVDRSWADKEWTLFRAMSTSRLWWLLFMNVFYGFATYVLIVNQVVYLKDAGYSPMFAAWAVFAFGIVLAVGMFCGFVSDRMGRERTYALGSLGVLAGMGLLLLIRDTSQPWLPYLYVLVWGFSGGLIWPLPVVAAADLFQGKHFGAINGFTVTGLLGGGAMGTWLSGFIFDVTRSYSVVFSVAAVALVASVLCFWMSAPRKVRLVAGQAPRRVGAVAGGSQ